LLDGILPPRCLGCAGVVDGEDVAVDAERVDAAGRGPADGWWCAVCAEQLTSSPVSGAFVYAGPVADAIRRAKVGRDAAVARGLARWWESTVSLAPPHDAVTFVPAPWRRRLARGFDLPALLADALGRAGERPVVELLVATRHDPRLATSGSRDERLALVRGRFRVRAAAVAAAGAGRTVLVVDDVHTTGATLGEACGVLAAAGVRPVPWALAVTPG
jgi:predicted amidophosphoribosyltransferase